MDCPEITNPNRQRRRIDFSHYSLLHPAGRQLISSWFQRAWDQRNCKRDEAYEPFLFTWFAFYGWAACVTDTDIDRDIIDTLANEQTLREDFEQTVQKNQIVADSVGFFSESLPIFDVKSLNRRGILKNFTGNRQERLAYYLSHGANQFEPRCWRRHYTAGEPMPVDWVHILNAIYKVRCNLFHGLKEANSEINQTIVHSAYLILVTFLAEKGYLHVTENVRPGQL